MEIELQDDWMKAKLDAPTTTIEATTLPGATVTETMADEGTP